MGSTRQIAAQPDLSDEVRHVKLAYLLELRFPEWTRNFRLIGAGEQDHQGAYFVKM